MTATKQQLRIRPDDQFIAGDGNVWTVTKFESCYTRSEKREVVELVSRTTVKVGKSLFTDMSVDEIVRLVATGQWRHVDAVGAAAWRIAKAEGRLTDMARADGVSEEGLRPIIERSPKYRGMAAAALEIDDPLIAGGTDGQG